MTALWATSDIITAAKLNKSFNSGLDADKGTPSVIGEAYLATDTNKLYYSLDGTTWGYVIETITGSQAKVDTHAALTATSTVDGHATAAQITKLEGIEALADVTANNVPQVHGAAQHTDITRKIFLPMNSGYVSAGTPGLLNNYGVVSGGANLEEPVVYMTLSVPVDFVSFTSIKLLWTCEAAAGNMYWLMGATYAAAGESKITHSDSPAMGVTATGGAGIMNLQTPLNPLTMAGLAVGDYVGVGVRRSGATADDTLDAAVTFLGIVFEYIANQ